MRYEAFISYRHSELDMEIAKKVHSGLETYKIPKSVQTSLGKKKMGRVFRDQEELPIGSDLDDNITSALEESEHLIVICSPRTPESYWVCKEIDTFIEMHDRNHILAVLIEGEPDESFPPQLLVDDEGNPVEPLAADVRGQDKKERNAKFKTEILRLAAPLIGCTYDDLKQRHRERIIKRTIAIVSAIAAVVAIAGTAFGLYNAKVAAQMTQLANEKAALADEKTRLAEEIAVQYEGKLENQSRFYAEESLSLLKSGNREDAILVALEALPSETNERPYVADAEYALSQALYAYDAGNSMTYDRILQHDLTVDIMTTSEDKGLIITVDNGSKVYVWDTTDWSLKQRIDPVINESAYYTKVTWADADDTGIYIATDKELVKYDYDGNVLYKKQFEDDIEICDSCADTGKLVVVTGEEFRVFDAVSGTDIAAYENTTGYPFMSAGRYYKDAGLYITSHFDLGAPYTYLSVYDVLNKTYRDIKISEGYSLDFTVTPNGNIAVVSCNSDMLQSGVNHVVADLVTPEGDTIWSKQIDAHVKTVMTFNTILKAHKFIENGEEFSDIVITVEAEAFTLNENDGSIVAAFNLPGEASALTLILSNSYGRVGYRQGDFDFVDFHEGRIYSEYTFETEESIREWVVLNDKLAYTSMLSPEIHVVTWHEAPDIEDYHTFDYEFVSAGVSSDGSYFAVRPETDYQTYIFVDADGTELSKFEGERFIDEVRLFKDRAILSDSDGLSIVDPRTGSVERLLPTDYGFPDRLKEVYINRDGTKCVFWTIRDIMVLDLETKEVICEYTADTNLGRILISDDGSRLYCSNGQNNMFAIDTSTGTRIEFKDDRLKCVADSLNKDYFSVSSDGKYVALCCMDGVLRVVDTATLETYAEAPLQSYLRSYVAFTDDGSHIVVQGDDYRIRILDMETKSYINTLDGAGSLDYLVCDDESGLMAMCQGERLYLVETNGYGRVAYAQRGFTYLKGNNSILLSQDMVEVKRTYYKDCNELVNEAKKQFPDASLSDEKRAKYNIN